MAAVKIPCLLNELCCVNQNTYLNYCGNPNTLNRLPDGNCVPKEGPAIEEECNPDNPCQLRQLYHNGFGGFYWVVLQEESPACCDIEVYCGGCGEWNGSDCTQRPDYCAVNYECVGEQAVNGLTIYECVYNAPPPDCGESGEWDYNLGRCVCNGNECVHGIVEGQVLIGYWTSCNNDQDCCCLLAPR